MEKAVIVLNRPTCSLVANVRRLQYANFVLQVSNAANEATDKCVCETTLPDVMASEAHQNDRSYLCELSGPTFDSLHKNLA